MSLSRQGIYYEEIGEGVPVVILHGAMLDHVMMKSCLEPVFQKIGGHKRFYLDLPGMGESFSSEEVCSSDAIVKVIQEFIHEYIPKEEFVLIGQSYGGYLVRGLLGDFADRIKGVFYLCPVIEPLKEKRHVPCHEILEIDEGLEPAQDLKQLYSGMFVVQTQKTYERFLLEIYPGIQKADKEFLTRLQTNAYEFSFSLPDQQQSFDFPALFLLGRQDACVGFEDALAVSRSYEHATLLIVDKAGHNLQIEQDGMFESVTENFFIQLKNKKCEHEELYA